MLNKVIYSQRDIFKVLAHNVAINSVFISGINHITVCYNNVALSSCFPLLCPLIS